MPVTPDSIRDRLQTTLGAAYRLDRELGGGGMSRVFVADETGLGRTVVIKLLSPELSEGLNVDRFHREIQVAARLSHDADSAAAYVAQAFRLPGGFSKFSVRLDPTFDPVRNAPVFQRVVQ